MFRHFDTDQSGEIEKEEFIKMIHVMVKGGTEMSQKKLDTLWLTLDMDQSGSVDFCEFLLWYNREFGVPDASAISKSQRLQRDLAITAERERLALEAGGAVQSRKG